MASNRITQPQNAPAAQVIEEAIEVLKAEWRHHRRSGEHSQHDRPNRIPRRAFDVGHLCRRRRRKGNDANCSSVLKYGGAETLTSIAGPTLMGRRGACEDAQRTPRLWNQPHGRAGAINSLRTAQLGVSIESTCRNGRGAQSTNRTTPPKRIARPAKGAFGGRSIEVMHLFIASMHCSFTGNSGSVIAATFFPAFQPVIVPLHSCKPKPFRSASAGFV